MFALNSRLHAWLCERVSFMLSHTRLSLMSFVVFRTPQRSAWTRMVASSRVCSRVVR